MPEHSWVGVAALTENLNLLPQGWALHNWCQLSSHQPVRVLIAKTVPAPGFYTDYFLCLEHPYPTPTPLGPPPCIVLPAASLVPTLRLGAGQVQGDSWLGGCGGQNVGLFSCPTKHRSLGVKLLPSWLLTTVLRTLCSHSHPVPALALALLLHQKELYRSELSWNFGGGDRITGTCCPATLAQSAALGSSGRPCLTM